MTKTGRQRLLVSVFVAVLAVLLALAAQFSERARLLAVLVALLSLVSFVAYAADKSAARKRQWRTPEKTLHVLALAGGWPGALLAQYWFRHKTQKASFRLVFRLTVLANILLCWFLLTPQGNAWLAGLLARL
ncbi:DUF1294 domain-containing protein [Granulosicoccaceae sp. 1_MG-2023]|nr:DUF1294 domain-containing protein [Granulosicoccaceae sp. 1_MG-2023]